MTAGWKLAAALALLAGLLAINVGSYVKGRVDGRNLGAAEQAAADKKADLQRKGDDAKLQNLSPYDLCVAGLRGNGMPIDQCDELRGL